MLHNTRLIQRPFTIFQVGTLVVLFLTFGDADFHFAPGVLPVQRQGDDGVTFAVNAAVQRVEFALVEQQLTGARRVADIVGGSHGHGRKVGAEQEGFAILQDDIAIADVGFACTQGFDFPALQGETSLVFIFDKVFVTGAFIQRNGG